MSRPEQRSRVLPIWLGRLIGCDLVGMGDSGKLPDSGPDRYTYREQRDYLFRLLAHLGIDGNVVFVVHDWGSALGFDWAWPRQIPIDGEPDDVAHIVGAYSSWLVQSEVPKLFVNGNLGLLISGRLRGFCRTWPNQTEVTVPGLHFLQEDSPDHIGTAIAQFVRTIRSAQP